MQQMVSACRESLHIPIRALFRLCFPCKSRQLFLPILALPFLLFLSLTAHILQVNPRVPDADKNALLALMSAEADALAEELGVSNAS